MAIEPGIGSERGGRGPQEQHLMMKYKVFQAQLIFSLSFPTACSLSLNALFGMSSGIFSVDLGTTIGALQIGSLFAIFLFGIVTLQAYLYYDAFPEDRWTYKSLVSIYVLTRKHYIHHFFRSLLCGMFTFLKEDLLRSLTLRSGSWRPVIQLESAMKFITRASRCTGSLTN